MPIQITGSHSVWGAFQEYRAVGRGKPLIKTRQQHKDYLRENNYEEVGNDKSMAPPELNMKPDEWRHVCAEREREDREALQELSNSPEL